MSYLSTKELFYKYMRDYFNAPRGDDSRQLERVSITYQTLQALYRKEGVDDESIYNLEKATGRNLHSFIPARHGEV